MKLWISSANKNESTPLKKVFCKIKPKRPNSKTFRHGLGFGGFQGIMKDSTNGVYIGASEFRKDGYAAGY
jgi:hypothetical protein